MENEPPHDKTNRMACVPSEDSDQGIRPVWSESSLSTRRKLGSLATHWAHSKDSDQTERMPRLIWVFAGRTCHYVGFVMRRLKLSSKYTHLICFSVNWRKEAGVPNNDKESSCENIKCWKVQNTPITTTPGNTTSKNPKLDNRLLKEIIFL